MNEKTPAFVDEDGLFHRCDIWTRALVREAPVQRYRNVPEELREFFELFEVNCVKGCCGLDAFRFSSSLVEGLDEEQKSRIKDLLREQREKIEEADVVKFTTWDFNQIFLKEEFLVLLTHLESLVDDNSFE